MRKRSAGGAPPCTVPARHDRSPQRPWRTGSDLAWSARSMASRLLHPRWEATMSTTISHFPHREPALFGETVVVIGGSAGIGLETARLARAEGADVILTGRNAERLERAAADVGAVSSSAF